jgi:hypothetical protein
MHFSWSSLSWLDSVNEIYGSLPLCIFVCASKPRTAAVSFIPPCVCRYFVSSPIACEQEAEAILHLRIQATTAGTKLKNSAQHDVGGSSDWCRRGKVPGEPIPQYSPNRIRIFASINASPIRTFRLRGLVRAYGCDVGAVDTAVVAMKGLNKTNVIHRFSNRRRTCPQTRRPTDTTSIHFLKHDHYSHFGRIADAA